MPIYEYSCKKCGQTIEVIQKMSDPELKKHAGCGGALTKEFSRSGFQFKGSGWYVTDYAKKSESADKADRPEAPKEAAPKDGEKKAEPAAAKDAATTTEAKPKSEPKPSKSSGGKKE